MSFFAHLIAAFIRFPTFPEEQKTRHAALLSIILWTTFWLGVVGQIIAFWQPDILGVVYAPLILILISLGLWWVMKSGRVVLAASLLVIALLLLTVALIPSTGRWRSSIFVIFPGLVVMAGFLIGRRTGLGMAALVALLALTALLAAEIGLLPASLAEDYDPSYLRALLLSLLLAANPQFLSLGQLGRVLRQLNTSNAELRAIRASLEEQVVERTQRAEQARREAEAARAQLETEIYQTRGQVQLDAALRSAPDLHRLADNAAQALCQHVDAPLAAVFLLQGDGLEWAGGRAALASEQAGRRFRLGEGPVGQVGLERQPILLNNVPPDFFTLASGLGDVHPCQVAIWPLLAGDALVGVLELGLLHPLTPAQEQFLDRAGPALAASFQTALARRRVDELLAETQAQAEELQAREEELRAINEELQAQAEALHSLGPVSV